MSQQIDPRLIATRNHALDAALAILEEGGVLAVNHASVSKATGIARSTLYRHWPDVDRLRTDTFARAARPSKRVTPRTNGPLRADLIWLLSFLLTALNETPWGRLAPQVIAAAATDHDARAVINGFMFDRIASVEAVFKAAEERGELREGVPVRQLVEMAIAVPYFRKLIAGLPLDHDWLECHIDLICRLAVDSAGQ
ncbi:MAG: TetR/AcrR family transcriptional regulator [Devosia sp.]